MADIVSLKGEPITAPGTPQAALVDELEKLLEMARAGEIDGMVYAAVYYDDATRSSWKGRVTRSMLGSLEVTKHELCEHVSKS